jgi:hypothetical protein
MKLTMHVLKDPQAGFKQVRYLERFLWIGNNNGIQFFMDHLDILSTYLPLFPPMKVEVLKEISGRQKANIFCDALPHYYIKKMKEANTEPIQMSLRDLFQFDLNIEEAGSHVGRGVPKSAVGKAFMCYNFILVEQKQFCCNTSCRDNVLRRITVDAISAC